MRDVERRVAEFYDRHWSTYVPEIEPCREHLGMFFGEGEIENAWVLDAGCGTAVFSCVFAERGAKGVVALDLTEGSLAEAKIRAKRLGRGRVHFVRATMLCLPFRDEAFDVVWAWGAVHHTDRPSAALSELCRTVKIGGVFFLAVYLRTGLTWLHEAIRGGCAVLPPRLHRPAAALLALIAAPIVVLFKKREKSRKGETLRALIHDFYFTPVRHYANPEDVTRFLRGCGFDVEQFLPASGRFDSTSNFIVKARRVCEVSSIGVHYSEHEKLDGGQVGVENRTHQPSLLTPHMSGINRSRQQVDAQDC
jgi:ubiquinone/menaquinone biosynthesis C-methylase UbiE